MDPLIAPQVSLWPVLACSLRCSRIFNLDAATPNPHAHGMNTINSARQAPRVHTNSSPKPWVLPLDWDAVRQHCSPARQEFSPPGLTTTACASQAVRAGLGLQHGCAEVPPLGGNLCAPGLHHAHRAVWKQDLLHAQEQDLGPACAGIYLGPACAGTAFRAASCHSASTRGLDPASSMLLPLCPGNLRAPWSHVLLRKTAHFKGLLTPDTTPPGRDQCPLRTCAKPLLKGKNSFRRGF